MHNSVDRQNKVYFQARVGTQASSQTRQRYPNTRGKKAGSKNKQGSNRIKL